MIRDIILLIIGALVGIVGFVVVCNIYLKHLADFSMDDAEERIDI